MAATTAVSGLQAEIRAAVGDEVLREYMALAEQWSAGQLSLARFDRRGSRLLPLELHSRFVLEFGAALEVPFEAVRKPRRKRKRAGSPAPDDNTPHLTDEEQLARRLLVHAVAKNLAPPPDPVPPERSVKERCEELVAEVLRHARLVDSDVQVSDNGFHFLQPVRVSAAFSTENVVRAVHKFHWLLPEHQRAEFLSVLTEAPAPKQPKPDPVDAHCSTADQAA